jgi:uncharacterized protein
MKNIIGQPARGNDFYKRTAEITRISNSLSNGNNLQITAPRRVGKTSILWYLLDNDIDNRNYIYIDTESVESEEAFYKKLLSEVVKNPKVSNSKKLTKAFKEKSNSFFKKIKSLSFLGNAIELNPNDEVKNYYEEIFNFLTGYAKSEDIELILLIDEFPQTIENIKKNSENSAIKFLQTNRELRINPELNSKVKFIYTGSIGLNYTVAKLNATATINDLNSIEIGALSKEHANDLFEKLLHTNKRKTTKLVSNFLLEKIQWFIPFHIQLIVQEIVNQSEKEQEITIEIIEKSIKSIIDLRNQNHFDHYYSRLKTQFKGNEFKYADDLLKQLANISTLSKNNVLDLSAKYDVIDNYKRMIETLMYDGYINFIEDTNSYQFNSPIVKLWWLKFIC